MIVRDLDVLVEAAPAREVGVVFSVPTLDEEVWRRTEPGTPPPRRRLEALRELVDAGIEGGRRDGADPAGDLRLARAARGRSSAPPARPGATGVWANVLYLKPGTREHFLDALARDWPEELDRYERLYASRCLPPEGAGRSRSAARSPSSQAARHPRPAAVRWSPAAEPSSWRWRV